MIVEVVTGADERPEARVVDIEDLSRCVLALGQVTDEEAADVLYHLSVLLASRGISHAKVMEVLNARSS